MKPQTTARQAPLSFTISQHLLKFMFTECVMLSNHLILCHPLLPLPSIFPSIRVFSNESALLIRWPMHWSFSFNNTREVPQILISSLKHYHDLCFTEGGTEAQRDLVTYLGITQKGSGRACSSPLSCAVSKCAPLLPRRGTWIPGGRRAEASGRPISCAEGRPRPVLTCSLCLQANLGSRQPFCSCSPCLSRAGLLGSAPLQTDVPGECSFWYPAHPSLPR